MKGERLVRDKRFEEMLKNSEEIAPRSELKNKILTKAQEELSANSQKNKTAPSRFFSLKRFAVPIAACFVFLFVAIGVLIGLNGENYQTVYIDVNPSVSIEINRFGKISGVNYINEDAKTALAGTNLKGKSAEAALEKIIYAYAEAGYFSEDSELNISAVDKGKKTDKLLGKLAKRAEKIKGSKKYTVNVSKLTADEREEAKEHGISPGKYKVISEIIGANPEYTVEDLKDKSMAELKDLLPKADKNPNKNNKK